MKRRGQESPVPEESTKETVKTIRVRECRVNRRDRGDLLACFFHLHARLRVRLAPGIPHALFGRTIRGQLGRNAPRGCGVVSRRHCEERKRPARRGFSEGGSNSDFFRVVIPGRECNERARRLS